MLLGTCSCRMKAMKLASAFVWIGAKRMQYMR